MAYHPISAPASGSSSTSGLQFLNFPFGDTTYTKVFVGGLAWETHSEAMRRYFQHFGEILEAVVITDKNTGRSKGYGFVTFRDPDSAFRACADPAPIIDNRRANCNLASLGRSHPSMFPPYGRLRVVNPFLGGATPRTSYVGNFGYQQSLPYTYQQGFMYPPYDCPPSYGAEYVYPQGVYNPYFQIYGVPGPLYSYGQGITGYPPPIPSYAMPSHQIVQFGGPAMNAITTSPLSIIQSPYPPSAGGVTPPPGQPHFIGSHFIPPANSGQTVG